MLAGSSSNNTGHKFKVIGITTAYPRPAMVQLPNPKPYPSLPALNPPGPSPPSPQVIGITTAATKIWHLEDIFERGETGGGGTIGG